MSSINFQQLDSLKRDKLKGAIGHFKIPDKLLKFVRMTKTEAKVGNQVCNLFRLMVGENKATPLDFALQNYTSWNNCLQIQPDMCEGRWCRHPS